MQRSIRILGLAALASLLGACGSDDNNPAPAQGQAGGGRGGEVVTAGRDAGCPAGSERCACYGNGTCDQGLTCASDLCVRLDGGQATGGAGGAGGGAAGASGGSGVGGTSGTATGGIGQAGTSGTATGGIGQAGTSGTATGGIGQAGTSGTATGGIGQAGTSGTATGGIGQAGTSGTATGGMGVAGTGGTATGGMGVAGTSGTATGGMGVAGTGGTAAGGVAGGVSVGGSAGTAGTNTGGVATGGAPGGASTAGAANGGAPGGAGAGTGGAFGGSAGVGGNAGSGGIRTMTETEPNDSWSLFNDLGYGSVIVLAALQGADPQNPGQDTETFRFTLTAPRSDVEIRAFSGSPPSTSCEGLHLRFELFKSTDTSNYYARDVHNNIGTCTSLAWQSEPLMRGLPPGTYYLRLTINEYTPDPVPAYYVQLLVASECGDGVVSGSEQCDSTGATTCDPTTCQKIPLCGDGEILRPEMCDDGNTTDGDGCSSTCQREGTPEVEVNDTIADADLRAAGDNVVIRGDSYWAGDLIGATDLLDMYRVELASPAVVRFETFESALGYDCSVDARHLLRLYDSTGAYVVDNAYGTGIQIYCGAFAIGLDAGTYYLEFGPAYSIYSPGYHLEADFLDDLGSESEPNDTMAQADPLAGSGFVVGGTLSSATDVDYYAITVPAGYAVRAQTLSATNGTICDAATDTTLQLLDSQGHELAYNDDWYDRCSEFDGTGSADSRNDPNAWNYTGTTQTYYVGVRPYANGFSAAFNYRLAVNIRP